MKEHTETKLTRSSCLVEVSDDQSPAEAENTAAHTTGSCEE